MSHQAPLAMWLIFFFEKLLDVALSALFLPSLPVPVSIYFCVYHLEHYSLYHFCYHRMEVIDKCFSHDTVEEIVDALYSIFLCQISQQMLAFSKRLRRPLSDEKYFLCSSKCEASLRILLVKLNT